jgi:hypothetical protein
MSPAAPATNTLIINSSIESYGVGTVRVIQEICACLGGHVILTAA